MNMAKADVQIMQEAHDTIVPLAIKVAEAYQEFGGEYRLAVRHNKKDRSGKQLSHDDAIYEGSKVTVHSGPLEKQIRIAVGETPEGVSVFLKLWSLGAIATFHTNIAQYDLDLNSPSNLTSLKKRCFGIYGTVLIDLRQYT